MSQSALLRAIGRPPESGPRAETVPSIHGVEQRSMVRVLTSGSVDDGKSTLIGRLLWDAAELPEDTREAIAASAGPDGIPDVSLLLDGHEAERAQGITIDIAWRYFDVARRRYVIIDCPGHEQYTRNMATGASQADIAILLVDARHGIKPQTRRHAAILELVGIKRVILAVNKIDLVDWSPTVFRVIADEFLAIAQRSGFDVAMPIPVSGRLGDNVATRSARTPWYDGPILLDAMEQIANVPVSGTNLFRMPVQWVSRTGNAFRGLAGSITSGSIKIGDEIIDSLSHQRARVSRIVTFAGDQESASAGKAVTIGLDRDLDIARGSVLSLYDQPIKLARSFEARLVWLADEGPGHGGLLLRTATDVVPVSHFSVRSRLDLATLATEAAKTCGPNDIADVRLALSRDAAIDRFSEVPKTGRFILIDALTGATVAGGIVTTVSTDRTTGQGTSFRLTRSLLASTVCADLRSGADTDHEFRRRASEVASLMCAAGVSVEIDLANEERGERDGSGI